MFYVSNNAAEEGIKNNSFRGRKIAIHMCTGAMYPPSFELASSSWSRNCEFGIGVLPWAAKRAYT